MALGGFALEQRLAMAASSLPLTTAKQGEGGLPASIFLSLAFSVFSALRRWTSLAIISPKRLRYA